MSEKLKMLVVVIIVFFIISVDSLAQEFELGSRLYKQENGKWYNYHNGEKCDRIVPNRLIVSKKTKEKPTKSDFERLNISGIKVRDKRYTGGYYVLNIDVVKNPFEIAKKIHQSTDYDYVEFDSYVSFSSDPEETLYDSQQWNLKANRLDMPRAWDITTGNSSIILAFIDSGFKIDHEDLDGNIWINTGETAGDSVDNDSNGFIDDIHGWHFGGPDWREGGVGNDTIDDGTWHGTRVMGIAVAQTNNYESGSYIGIAGIAGGWGSTKGVSAMLLRTESSDYDDTDDSTYLTSVVDCITYAMNNGANVINMCFGIKYVDGYDYVRAVVDTAVDDYDCICVASTGNTGRVVQFPANYSKVISVGSVDSSDRHNYNRFTYEGSCYDIDDTTNGREIDLVAPTNVHTTLPNVEEKYGEFGGTSASAPHVSALAALILSINEDLTPGEVREILTTSTDKDLYYCDGYTQVSYDANGWDKFVGYGRINAYKALKKTIEEYGGSGETFTFNNDVTIQSGDTLTIDSCTTVEFYPGKRLIVKGTLFADDVTFTKASTSNWGGIIFDNASSSCTIENCTITYADTGIKLTSSDITIEGNEIYNISKYGIYSYGSSPIIETNEIYNTGINGYGIYAYDGNPEITDNYVHDISDYGIAINASGSNTYIRYNSVIDCEGGVYLFGQNTVNLRGKIGASGGYNNIEDYDDGPGTYGIMITGGEPDLGSYSPSSHRGYNNFIHDGRDIVYNSTDDEVMAEKNYWGGSPQSSWFTGDVNYDFPLSSRVSTAGSSLEKPVPINDDRQLLYTANELLDTKSYLQAADIYKQLIEDYPDSRFAGIALARAMSAHREKGDLVSQRSYLQGKTKHKNPKVSGKAWLWLQTLEAWSGNKSSAVQVVKSVDIDDSVGVEIRLNWANDLVNIYNDKVTAQKVFDELLAGNPSEGTLMTIEAIGKTASGFENKDMFKTKDEQEEIALKIPKKFALYHAYPNPFNPSTTIKYDIPKVSNVDVKIFNILGQLVKNYELALQPLGAYNLTWDGTNTAGVQVPSGVYIVRLNAEPLEGKREIFQQSIKVTLLR